MPKKVCNDLYSKFYTENSWAIDYAVNKFINIFSLEISGLDRDDITSQATEEFLLAIDLYDPSKGASFSTFYLGIIHFKLQKYFNKNASRSQHTEHAFRSNREITKFETQFYIEHGRYPTDSEIASALDKSLKVVKKYRNLPAMLSLDQTANYDGEYCLLDTIQDHRAVAADERLIQSDEEDLVSKIKRIASPEQYRLVMDVCINELSFNQIDRKYCYDPGTAKSEYRDAIKHIKKALL